MLTRPINHKDLVNAQRATVTAVHPDHTALTIRTDAGRTVTLDGDEIDAEHLDHGCALTVHRTQAATVDRAHLFADGGGRQLGYVAISRARHRATVHAVADDLAMALEDIEADWSTDRSQRWLTDTASPGHHTRPLPVSPETRLRQLRAELADLHATIPPDPTAQLHETAARLAQLRADRADLDHGAGRWTDTPAGRAARRLNDAQRARLDAQHHANDPQLGWRQRRHAQRSAHDAARAESLARQGWHTTTEPAAQRLDHQITHTEHAEQRLRAQQTARQLYLRDHPQLTRHIEHVQCQIHSLEHPQPRTTVAGRAGAATPAARPAPDIATTDQPDIDPLDDAIRNLHAIQQTIDRIDRRIRHASYEPPAPEYEPPAPDLGLGL